MRFAHSVLLIACVVVLLAACGEKPVQYPRVMGAVSPNEQLKIRFDTSLAGPELLVSYKDMDIMHVQTMGVGRALVFRQGEAQQALDWDSLVLQNFVRSTNRSGWVPVWGQHDTIIDAYEELVVELGTAQSAKDRTAVTFRVRAYDDGFAFRYEWSPANADSIHLLNETTTFVSADNGSCWFIPADFDTYEKDYSESRIFEVEDANTPITCKTDSGVYFSIHEAALTDFAGMTLKQQQFANPGLQVDLVPWPDGVKVRAGKTLVSPWRTVQVADTPGKLAESTMILNLNEPNKLDDTSWIQPMTYCGIWWGMHLGVWSWGQGENHGATTENTKRYIDFAAKHNIGGVLVEGWNTGWENWGKKDAFDYTTAYDDFDMEALAAYADSQGVALIGHHETGGDVLSYEKNLEAAFAQCQRLGIHAVKTGYAGGIYPRGQHHHGQYMVRHYRKVVETAAKYQIMIDAHEPIKPTGISRTWPNMMTREGVKGMEWNAWSSGNRPEQACILPYTRGLAGPIDYTPGIFDLTYENFPDRNFWNNPEAMDTARVHSTLANQLALYIVLHSPLQMAADMIENYEGQEALQFIESVPTTWDETRFLDGEIGEYVVVARRSGDTWYVAAINGNNPRELNVPGDFLEPATWYTGIWYEDADASGYRSNPAVAIDHKASMDEDTGFSFVLGPGGGSVVVVSPAAAAQ